MGPRGIISFSALVALSLSSPAAVVDRIAVVVGKTVITESEVLKEVRLTEFLNGQPVDPGPEQRRAAAERLVDQQLIRQEMQIGSYPQPDPAEADAVLRNLRQERYPTEAQFHDALEKYGITEDEVRRHLLWQLSVLHFTDVRFQNNLLPEAPAATVTALSAPAGRNAFEPPGSAQRDATTPSPAAADRTVQSAATPSADRAIEPANVDSQMDAWLKETRGKTKIQFKKEAFQ